MSCPACDGVEGASHSCGGSGTWLAAEAHDTGELVPAEPYPLYDVQLDLVVRAFDERGAREKLTGMVAALLDDDDIAGSVFTIRERVTA